jgi:oligopeptide/dipeptide ABC transporter ATP-binding protein
MEAGARSRAPVTTRLDPRPRSSHNLPVADADPLLAVRDLSVAFPSGRHRNAVRAVDGVSLDVHRGETLCLVGETGSGKTLTALASVRLVPAPGRVTAGRIAFDGRDLLAASERELQHTRGAGIGFVFQEPMTALNPVYTIGAQIAETLAVHGVASGAAARRHAVELLDAVRIPAPARRAQDYPHQLSGGMRQRALIAAALACTPSLLIADEPTTALDVRIQAGILDLLREMQTRLGLALLLITHDLGVVAELADRIAVMYAGRIVETGPAGEVLAAPAHPYTRGLLASRPGLTPGASLQAIPGSVPDLAALPKGCAFGPRCADRVPACESAPPQERSAGVRRTVRCVREEGRA